MRVRIGVLIVVVCLVAAFTWSIVCSNIAAVFSSRAVPVCAAPWPGMTVTGWSAVIRRNVASHSPG